jgi:DNA (cytosine-5)-methyltransferase 1
MREGSLDGAPVWTDLRTFDGRPWRGVVDIVTAGWPCQPFSTMGKRKGREDPRHLWPHVRRVVDQVRPLVLFGENVPNHVDIGFDDVAGDLREMGYACEAGLFTAAEVGGAQVRKRLFVLAHAEGEHASDWECESLWGASAGGRAGGLDQHEQGEAGPAWEAPHPPRKSEVEDWGRVLSHNPQAQPAFFGVADELASGMGKPELAHRETQIRLMGNGVVPSCAAFAFSLLLGRATNRLPRPD